MKEVRVGMVGYKFMGKAHSHAYKDLTMFFPDAIRPVMKAICGRNEEGVKQACEQFGWESWETDWRKLVARDDIDLIDINAPSNAHKEIALEAAKAGKHLFCEKPLALTSGRCSRNAGSCGKSERQAYDRFQLSLCPGGSIGEKTCRRRPAWTNLSFSCLVFARLACRSEFPVRLAAGQGSGRFRCPWRSGSRI